MKELKYSTEINAPRANVWKTLWDDTTFRDWAGIIDEGTYIKGVLKEGTDVEFISSVNGYGVTSFVEKFTPDQLAFFRHKADTQESGAKSRDNEWTGTSERYELSERNGGTVLTLTTQVPPEQEQTFQHRLPKALARIKELASVARP
jgi:uncharacterized protein YndB with AHSA1/START domain